MVDFLWYILSLMLLPNLIGIILFLQVPCPFLTDPGGQKYYVNLLYPLADLIDLQSPFAVLLLVRGFWVKSPQVRGAGLLTLPWRYDAFSARGVFLDRLQDE